MVRRKSNAEKENMKCREEEGLYVCMLGSAILDKWTTEAYVKCMQEFSFCVFFMHASGQGMEV